MLHRWDAHQAAGVGATIDRRAALELTDEFLDTDVARALGERDRDRAAGFNRPIR